MQTTDLRRAIEFADWLLAECYAIDVSKALDPTDPSDFLVIQNQLTKKLKAAAAGSEAIALRAALEKLDVDWPKISVAQRNAAVQAAKKAIQAAAPPVAAKTAKIINVTGPGVIKGTKKSLLQSTKLVAGVKLNQVDQRVLDAIVGSHSKYVRDQFGKVSASMGKKAQEIVAGGLAQGVGRDVIAERLATALGAGMNAGYWGVVANAFTARARSAAGISFMSDAGVTQYKIEAVLDRSTTVQCRFLHGKTYSVADAQATMLKTAADPTNVAVHQPWLQVGRSSKGVEFIYYKDAAGKQQRVANVTSNASGQVNAKGKFSHVTSAAKLQEAGIDTPPFHGNCRTTIIADMSSPVVVPEQIAPAAPPKPPLPKPEPKPPKPKPKPAAPKPAPAKPKPAPAKPTVPALPRHAEIMHERTAGAAGSNAGGFYRGTDGVDRYVKLYTDPTQAQSEHLANSIYRQLGLDAPKSEVFDLADGGVGYASEIIKDGKTLQSSGVTAAKAKKAMDGFVADVLTANWDAAGLGMDNMMVLPKGGIARIDNGGTFLFRAQQGRKPKNLLNQITEWDVFLSTKNPSYSKLARTAGFDPLGADKQRVIKQIDKVVALRKKHGGWGKYVRETAPGLKVADRTLVIEMLEARTKLLVEKRAELAFVPKPMAPIKPGKRINPKTVLSHKKTKGLNGTSYTGDSGWVENQDIHVRLMREGTNKAKGAYEFQFKVTSANGTKVRDAANRYGAAETAWKHPKKQVSRGMLTHQSSTPAETGNRGIVWEAKTADGTGIRARLGTDGALQNQMHIIVDTDDPEKALAAFEELTKNVGIQDIGAAPAEQAKDWLVRTKVVAQFDPVASKELTKAAALPPNKRTAAIKKVYDKVRATNPVMDKIVKDAKAMEVFPGHSTYYSQAQANYFKQNGVKGLFHDSGAPPEIIADMLTGDGAGLMSSTARYERGIFTDGMSTRTDFRTGGADGVFMRIAKDGRKLKTMSGTRFVIKTEQLGRQDWWAFNFDNYGRSDAANIKRRWSARSIAEDAVMKSGNEVMAQKGVPLSAIEKVITSQEKRAKVLKILRGKGVTQINGKKIEDFIVLPEARR